MVGRELSEISYNYPTQLRSLGVLPLHLLHAYENVNSNVNAFSKWSNGSFLNGSLCMIAH